MKMFLGRTALRQILVLLPVYANGITSGCIIGWAANVVYLLCRPDAEIKVTTAELWWMASMMEIGKMVFSIPAGILADRIGKENILTNVGIIHFTSWMMLSICSSVPLICLARFLAGLGTALLSASAMATIGEIASPEIRGMLAGLEQVFVMMGILSQALITAIYPSYNVLTYITVIISSIYFVTMFWLIETPPSLIKARKYNQARSNLRYLRPELTDKQVDDEYQQLKSYIEEQSILTSDMDCMHFIRSKSTFRPIAISVGINFFMLLTGVVVVLTYITEIVPQNDLVPKRFYPLIITGVSLFSTISTSFFVDKFPRRVLFMTAAAFTSVLQAYNGLTYYLFAHVGVQWCAWAFAIGNFLFRVHWAFLLLPVNGAMRSEIFPQNVKGIGNALSDMAQAAAITLSFKLYSYMSDDLTGLYYIFSSSAIILLILLYFYLPEGRGKSLVEIQKEKDVVMGNASLYMKQVP